MSVATSSQSEKIESVLERSLKEKKALNKKKRNLSFIHKLYEMPLILL
jgi:hypothetical protein